MRQHTRAGMAFIFFTLLIDVLGFGLVIPVLPKLVQHLAHGNASAGASDYGLLLSCFGLMQFLFSPVLGSLSDRYGRRPVLLLSLFCSGIDYVIMANAPTVGWLFVGRILSGITSASFTTATAYIADVTPPERRAQNFGMIGAAFGLGFIIGPGIGGFLGSYGLRWPFWAAAGMSALNCLYGLFVLPESLPAENRRPFSLKSSNPLGALAILARHRWVLALTGCVGLQALAGQATQTTWVLYTTYRYGWSVRDNGNSLALLGLASIFVQVVVIRILVARIGERGAVVWGLLFNFIGVLGFALASRGWIMMVILPIWSLCFAAGPATQSLISSEYGPDEQGAVQGALTSLQSLTGIVGPILFTAVFGYFTSPAAPIHVPGAAFFLSALLIALSAALAASALRTHSERPAVTQADSLPQDA
jgi:DHA1 family tetracycline resistance protein-like MFS transporter